MKRILCAILSLSLLLSICACGAKDDSTTQGNSAALSTMQSSEAEESESSNSEFNAVGDIEVEDGLFNVSLTIPSDFVDEETTQETLDQAVKENGYKSAILNADGSVTYVMTKAQHQEMMQGIEDSIDESLMKMVGSEDYPNIVSIESNDDYSQYTVSVSSEEVGLSESFAVLQLYVFSGMYHVFNGTTAENVSVQYVNEATGEIIQEANSNDME